MEREELVEWINSLEKKYQVNEWCINGIHVWPILKVKILFVGFKTTESNNSNSKTTLLKSSIKGASEYLKLLTSKARVRTELYCLAPHFRFTHEGIYKNRYYNNLIRACQGHKDFLLFDYGSGSKQYQKNVDYPENTLFLGNIKYFALALREIVWRSYKPKSEWRQFDLLLKEVNSVLGANSLSKTNLIRQVAYIDLLKKLYKPLLRRNKVDVVYILCYYVSEMYAMTLATAELGIVSYDIQHGGQGKEHVAYANYNVAPQEGYKLMPRKFWCWDESSAETIQKWTGKQKYHSVEAKGNPWVEHCIGEFSSDNLSDKKLILYTMQPLGGILLDDYIIEAIKKTPFDFEWWLRLHPRQLEEKSKLISLLKQHNIYNRVEIEKAVELPLPSLLNQCFIHISKFSGSILEAHMLNVKTIILSRTGVESFPEVAKSNLTVTLLNEDSDKLVEHIICS